MAAEGGHHHYPTLTQTKTLEPKSTFLSGKVQQEPKKRKKTEAVKRNSTHCIWCEKKSKWSLICLLFKVVRWVQRSVALHRQYEDGKTRFWRQRFGLFFNSRDTRPITASPGRKTSVCWRSVSRLQMIILPWSCRGDASLVHKWINICRCFYQLEL